MFRGVTEERSLKKQDTIYIFPIIGGKDTNKLALISCFKTN